MAQTIHKNLHPGVRVKVTQQIVARDYSWPVEISGTIVDYEQKPTGSWFAHSKDDRLWLDRLSIRKDDGELTTLSLDDNTHIEIDTAAAAAAATGPEKTNESDLPA